MIHILKWHAQRNQNEVRIFMPMAISFIKLAPVAKYCAIRPRVCASRVLNLDNRLGHKKVTVNAQFCGARKFAWRDLN
jgi:hypothetical protein